MQGTKETKEGGGRKKKKKKEGKNQTHLSHLLFQLVLRERPFLDHVYIDLLLPRYFMLPLLNLYRPSNTTEESLLYCCSLHCFQYSSTLQISNELLMDQIPNLNRFATQVSSLLKLARDICPETREVQQSN